MPQPDELTDNGEALSPIYTGLIMKTEEYKTNDPNQWPKCHWAFQEKCHLERFHPSLCDYLGCKNFTHTRCAVEWRREKGFPFNDPIHVGLYCREHHTGYYGLLHSSESYNVNNSKVYVPPAESFEPCVGDLNSNGLWFAPKCSSCCLTNKYLHIGNKHCQHHWKEVRLNRAGEYILFNSDCFHWGYFNDIKNSVSVTAQLFCGHSTKEDMERVTRTSSHKAGEGDFVSGRLNKDLINNLTKVVVNEGLWKEYFPQCMSIEESSNRQIDGEDFDKVPLIRELVIRFESMYSYLSIHQVWLICKSELEPGLQG